LATKSIQRSLKVIKEYGWQYWITEKWNPYSRTNEDMFGFCDILCLSDCRTIAIQSCAGGGDYMRHVRKIRDNEYAIPWLFAGNEIQIWAWRQLKKKRGGKAKIWKPRVADILLVGGELYFEERKK
jgi:hypothetical protein